MPLILRKLHPLRPLAWGLLGLVSSVIGISFLYFGVALFAGSLISLLIFLPKGIGVALSLLGQLFSGSMLGICVSRYLRRIDPLRMEIGKPARFAWLKSGMIIAYSVFLMLPMFPRSVFGLRGLPLLGALLPIGASLFERYIMNFSPADEPFVLFLRGFRGLADRSVVPSVLAAIPHGRRVVFLVPRFSGTVQWDPFTLGLSGFRPLQPLRSMPVYISATDEQWVEVVRNLIRRAESIVIDLSRDSPAIRTELQLIMSEGRMRETIIIDPAKDSPAEAILQKQLPPDSGAPFLRWCYRKTWLGGSLRMLGGMVLMGLMLAFLAIMLPGTAPWLPSRVPEDLAILFCALFMLPFFAKPLITRDLRRFLARALSSYPSLEPLSLPQPPIRKEIPDTSPPARLRIGRRGVVGVYLCAFSLEGVFLGSYAFTGPSPFWKTAFQTLGWVTVILGALDIVQGVLSVRKRRTGLGWMTTGGSTNQPKVEGVQAEIRHAVLREWIEQLIEVDDQVLRFALALAILTAVAVFIATSLLWTLLFFALSFLAFFALGDFLGSLIARHRLLSNLEVARPTDDELRRFLEHHGLSSAHEDLELVLVRYRARRKSVPASLSRPFLAADEVIVRLQSLEALRTSRWSWLLAPPVWGILYAILFEDPWAAILGIPIGLAYGSLLVDVKRFFKLIILRRKLHSWQVTLTDHQHLIDYMGQRVWKNKGCQKKCRNLLLRAAARDTAEVLQDGA